MAANDKQEGGEHYKKHGDHQPWDVLRSWLTPEEYRGYMKGTMIVYLAREKDKGGDQDIRKVAHYGEKFVEVLEELQRGLLVACIRKDNCDMPSVCKSQNKCRMFNLR